MHGLLGALHADLAQQPDQDLVGGWARRLDHLFGHLCGLLGSGLGFGRRGWFAGRSVEFETFAVILADTIARVVIGVGDVEQATHVLKSGGVDLLRGEGDIEVVEADLLGVAVDGGQGAFECIGDDDGDSGGLVVDEEVEELGWGWLGGNDDHRHQRVVVRIVSTADEGVGPVVQGEGAVRTGRPSGEVVGEVMPGLLVGELG